MNIINDLFDIKKIDAFADISGISNDGEYQNFFATIDFITPILILLSLNNFLVTAINLFNIKLF